MNFPKPQFILLLLTVSEPCFFCFNAMQNGATIADDSVRDEGSGVLRDESSYAGPHPREQCASSRVQPRAHVQPVHHLTAVLDVVSALRLRQITDD